MKLCKYYLYCKKNKMLLYCKNISENENIFCTSHLFNCLAIPTCKNIRKNDMQFCEHHEKIYKYNIAKKMHDTIFEVNNETSN